MVLGSNRLVNRKLPVSVFHAQEAREAILGGGRIIDSEDPKSALGNRSPRHIMDVSDAVLDFHRDFAVQLSTNIGADQLWFRRSQTGQAIEKSRYEIAGKASEAALGVAHSMGMRVHPVSWTGVRLLRGHGSGSHSHGFHGFESVTNSSPDPSPTLQDVTKSGLSGTV
jgi:hypothetical protein